MLLNLSWGETPPATTPALANWLTDQGSLTERLIATGHAFSVTVLQQGQDRAYADEPSLIELGSNSMLYARHVALALDGICVVVARSIAPLDSQAWMAVLERGNRSLGLTLFGQDNCIVRKPLRYRELESNHPLFALASSHDPARAPHYAARRSNFILEGAALNVCEIFLPALENFL